MENPVAALDAIADQVAAVLTQRDFQDSPKPPCWA
jgi:hypothetical protein